MRYLSGEEHVAAEKFLNDAANVARQSTCQNAHCGAVIVKNGKIIGQGFNSPPQNDESQRTCNTPAFPSDKPRFDQTCCIHAEWRAIFDAFKHHPDTITGARLYFTWVDSEGNPKKAGKPYCTVCSRLALESGLAEFVLWHDKGIGVYDTKEYNLLSYRYFSEFDRNN